MLFAGLTSVIAKLGLKSISPDFGLVIRTSVVLVLVLTNFLVFSSPGELKQLSIKPLMLLIVSGLTTSLSWILYYKAIHIGRVSDVALIDKGSIVITVALSYLILGEAINLKLILGCALVVAGLFVLAWR